MQSRGHLVVLIIAVPLTVLFAWGFKNLPGARWQMLGAVPVLQKDGSISAYQIMALVGAAYVAILPLLISSSSTPVPDIALGLASLWSPGIILTLQALWVISFVYTGKSSVTESSIEFTVRKQNI